jgi:hypothetical protein
MCNLAKSCHKQFPVIAASWQHTAMTRQPHGLQSVACRSPQTNIFLIRTVDHTPPAFTGGTPYVQNIQATAFDVVVQQNKTGRVYYVVVEQVCPLNSCCSDENRSVVGAITEP